MNFISTMPAGLCYSVKQEEGKKEGFLDMRATAVSVVPKALKGVDCVVAWSGQVRYVAPDYRGKILVCYGPLGQSKVLMSKKEMQDLKIGYQRAAGVEATQFFDVSMLNAQGQEQNMPANLSFDPETRLLDARHTVLTSCRIKGVLATKLPDHLLQNNRDLLRHQRNLK